MSQQKNWATLYISVPATLKERIIESAAADDRSVGRWIGRIIAEHFAKEDAACSLPSLTSQPLTISSSESGSSPPESCSH